MRKRLYGRILPALTLLITTQFALADSTRARCDIYPAGSDHASASIACTFSQYQGNVYIDRSDGVSYELVPTGDVAGNFVDQSGKAVYRQSGLGNAGLIFRMSAESVYVYWDASSLEQAAGGEDNLTAPYTTAEYDATIMLTCSIDAPSHNESCPAGIRRGTPGSGSGTIHVTAPDGSERVLEFADGDVTTSGGGELTWGKQGDEWYIGIDNREFYVVPEAAVYGG
jgi:hypothetical protein